jgi:hypothetical protein
VACEKLGVNILLPIFKKRKATLGLIFSNSGLTVSIVLRRNRLPRQETRVNAKGL